MTFQDEKAAKVAEDGTGGGESGGGGAATDEQRRMHIFNHHAQKILEARKAVDEAREFEAGLRKLAKADGIRLSAVDTYLKVMTAEDDSKIADRVKADLDVLRWTGVIPWDSADRGYQADIFADTRSPEVKSFEDGRAASARGLNPTAPSELPQHLQQEWMRGWHLDQEERRRVFQSDMEERNKAAAEKKAKKAAAPKAKAAKSEKVVPFSKTLRDKNKPADDHIKSQVDANKDETKH